MLQIEHAPDLLEVTVSAPAVLGHAQFWRVVAGEVEVYAIIQQDGRQVGNRRFIRSATAGDVLFPGVADTRGLTCQLVAFTLDRATLQPVPHACLIPSQASLDAWIEAFAIAVEHACGGHQGGGLLFAGDTVSLLKGSDIRAGRDVVWARIGSGAAALRGQADHVYPEGSLIPLTASGWIQIVSDSAELRGLPTSCALAEPNWSKHLIDWQMRMQMLLATGAVAAEQGEVERVRRAVHWSEQTMRATMGGLADALIGKDVPHPSTSLEPLAAVCRAVAQAMGFDIPAQAPRASPQTVTMLERVARCTGAPAREIALQGAWWREELGPLIAFQRDTRAPIAVLPIGRRRSVMHDPATGETRSLTAETAESLEISAFVLCPPLPDRPLRARDLLWLGMQQSRRDLVVILLTGILSSVLALAVPASIGLLVDEFIPSHLEPQLLELGGLLLLVVLAMVVVRIAQDLAQLRVVGRSASRLQPGLMDRTVRLETGLLKQFTSADLAQRVTVIDAIRHGLSVIVMDAMLSGLFSLNSILLLLFVSPPLAAIAAILAVPFVAVATWASLAQLPELAVTEARSADAAQLVYQLVDNITHLRAAGAEERAFARWGALHRDLETALLRSSRTRNRLIAFISGYGIVCMAAFFGVLHWTHPVGLTVGQLVMAVSVFGSFLATFSSFGNGLQRLFLLQPKLARAQVLLAATPEVLTSQRDPGDLAGRIEVSHVSFAYSDRSGPTLDDISLSIEPGQFVAIVGPSGSGKSTIMKLLLGFERAQSGSIFYDGQDLKRLDIRAVRRQIGTVLQTGRIMPGTLFDNILGAAGRTNEEAWEAARLAGIAEDIEAMPMGMHTMMTDGGTMLSGGQVQRLLIARALVGKPRIIFFDEATSALDNNTQSIVMQSLQRMAVTRLVIAHRLTTVRQADRIIVVNAGRIVQSGTYDELANQPGLFADLIRRQET